MLALSSQPDIQIQRILDAALAGRPPEREDACLLSMVTGNQLLALFQTASLLRDRHKGGSITYSRKAFFPLTNLCRDTCGYCTFVQQPDQPTAHTMTPEEVIALARQAEAAGCKEALFSLGDKPELKYASHRRWLAERGYESTLDYLADMCRLVATNTGLLPHANPGILTAEDITALRPYNASMGIMLENVSPRLLLAGMPHHRCPDKVPQRRLETIAEAGRQRVAFTTGILIGIGETPEERVESLLALRALHQRYGHIQEIIIQNFRAKQDIPMRGHAGPSILDTARTIAIARLLLPEMNIQAPPNLTPDAYGIYLLAGINDWGGVSPVTLDHINPEAPWPAIADLRRACAESGFQLRERLALYPEYVRADNGFIPEPLRARITALTDNEGLVRQELEW